MNMQSETEKLGKLCAIYFSGTGNTKWAVERFLEKLDCSSKSMFSVEDEHFSVSNICNADTILLAYPCHLSNAPILLRQFIESHKQLFRDKSVIAVCVQSVFSGDGGGILYHNFKGIPLKDKLSVHINLPSNLECYGLFNVKNGERNSKVIRKALNKIQFSSEKINQGKKIKEGQGLFAFLLGFIAHRMWFRFFENKFQSAIKFKDTCIACGLCAKNCPTQNIIMKNDIPTQNNKCTLCYRCINQCPKMAIQLMGKTTAQYHGIN